MTSGPLPHCHDQAVVRLHRRIGLEPGVRVRMPDLEWDGRRG
jgi:hypothetical protein